jgi:hypothetical protein
MAIWLLLTVATLFFSSGRSIYLSDQSPQRWQDVSPTLMESREYLFACDNNKQTSTLYIDCQ